MSPFPWSDLAILAALILLNGVFAMSELAIVSARTARLRMAAERGSSGAKTALCPTSTAQNDGPRPRRLSARSAASA